jgi:putative flavoprotein involved in K+ transport
MKNNLGKTHTLIIGAGQAGLSVGRYLKEYSIPFIILEKENSIGTSWSQRYDSLVLDSFAKYSNLEGFPFTGDKKRHPTKDEVAHYLQSFATHFGITPVFNTSVSNITKDGELFIVETNSGIYEAHAIVIATGPFQIPLLPLHAHNLPSSIHQLHAKEYKNPSTLPQGPILVVGGGNSGSEIAKELVENNRTVIFSYKGELRSVPSSQLSQWIAYTLGVAHIKRQSLLGKLVEWYTKGKSVGMDIGVLLKNKNISFVGELLKIDEQGIHTTKGILSQTPKTVIWATGYKSDFSILAIPQFDPNIQKRGVTNIDGLYVLNIRWQYSKSSSHLAGISRDAKYIAKTIFINSLKKS